MTTERKRIYRAELRVKGKLLLDDAREIYRFLSVPNSSAVLEELGHWYSAESLVETLVCDEYIDTKITAVFLRGIRTSFESMPYYKSTVTLTETARKQLANLNHKGHTLSDIIDIAHFHLIG